MLSCDCESPGSVESLHAHRQDLGMGKRCGQGKGGQGSYLVLFCHIGTFSNPPDIFIIALFHCQC